MSKHTYDHITYFIVRAMRVQDSYIVEILRGNEKLGHAACAYFEQFADRDGFTVAKLPASLAALHGGYEGFRVRLHDKPGHKIFGLRLFNKDIETLKAWWEATGSMKGDETWD